MGRYKLPKRKVVLPRLRLDVERILAKADNTDEGIAVTSDVQGFAFAYDKERILLLQADGFIVRSIDEMRIIKNELDWIVEEADRWSRS